MQRTVYKGAVRDSRTEEERDARMLALSEQGLNAAVIAQRMGLSINSVRTRIKRAREHRAAQD